MFLPALPHKTKQASAGSTGEHTLAQLLPQPGSAAWDRRLDELAHALASLPDGAHALQLTSAACTAALVQGLVSALLAFGAPDWQRVPEERGTAEEPVDGSHLQGRAVGVSFCGKVSFRCCCALLRLFRTCRCLLRVLPLEGLVVKKGGQVGPSAGCCMPLPHAGQCCRAHCPWQDQAAAAAVLACRGLQFHMHVQCAAEGAAIQDVGAGALQALLAWVRGPRSCSTAAGRARTQLRLQPG